MKLENVIELIPAYTEIFIEGENFIIYNGKNCDFKATRKDAIYYLNDKVTQINVSNNTIYITLKED